MQTYTILWGHSGTRGREWTTAREASRYASTVWGTVEAQSPADAIEIVRVETGEVADHYVSGSAIHIVLD